MGVQVDELDSCGVIWVGMSSIENLEHIYLVGGQLFLLCLGW